jgi:molybdate transport system permease protein
VRIVFAAALVLALAVALAFVALPLAALFLHTSPQRLVSQLGDSTVRDALLVSLKTSAVAHVLVLLVCTPAAYALARRRFRGRRIVLALVELPLVLPPAVAGIALLAAFGRVGLLGGTLSALGVSIPFTQSAVVLAVAFVETPFYLRAAIAAFESIEPTLLDAARTLGARPPRVFFRVALPLALGGLGAGSALALARGLGEFGATIVFAGSLQGVTQTLPLAIYAELDHNFDAAIAIGALFVVVGAAVLLAAGLLSSWTSFTSISRLRSASSTSS